MHGNNFIFHMKNLILHMKSIIFHRTNNFHIENITVNWDVAIEENLDGSIIRKILYPQSLVLSFSNSNKIFVSATGFLERDDEQVYPYLDKLTITQDEALAKQTRMIPPFSVKVRSQKG